MKRVRCACGRPVWVDEDGDVEVALLLHRLGPDCRITPRAPRLKLRRRAPFETAGEALGTRWVW